MSGGWETTENREYTCFYYGIEQAEQDIIEMYEYAVIMEKGE